MKRAIDITSSKPDGEPSYLHIVFDDMPSGDHDAKFIEIEDQEGAGVKVGQWVRLDDKHVALQIPLEEVGGLDHLDKIARANFEHVELSVSTMRTGKIRVHLYGQDVTNGTPCGWDAEHEKLSLAVAEVTSQVEGWLGP